MQGIIHHRLYKRENDVQFDRQFIPVIKHPAGSGSGLPARPHRHSGADEVFANISLY